MRQEMLDEIEDLPPEHIVAGMESQAERDRDSIWERKNAFRSQVRSFLLSMTQLYLV